MGKDFLGEFETVVLLALARLEEGAYAVSVHNEVFEETGRSVSIPAVYITLSRLEKKGMVTSWKGDPSPQRGGRAKRYFRLEPDGFRQLGQSREMMARLWEGLNFDTGPGSGQ